MAYQDMMGQNQQPSDLASAMAQRQARMEDNFFTGLLQYGLADANLPLPNKSKLWNEYVMLKKGRIGQQDLIKFESTYTQAKTLNYQKQLKEYDKLVLEGKSAKDIQKLVKADPVQYKNLLDMIVNLEQAGMAGDESALGAAMDAKQYLPQKSWGEELAADPGVGGSMAPYGAAAAAAGIGTFLSRPSAATVEARKAAQSKIKDAKSKLSSAKKDVKSQQKKVTAQQKSLQDHKSKKSNKKIIQKAQEHVNESKRKLAENRNTVKELNKTIKTPAPKAQSRFKQYTKKLGGKGKGLLSAPGIVGYGALKEGLPAAGSKLYGEKGEKAGELAGDIGLLGWGLAGLRKAPSPWAKALGYAPIAAQGAYGLANRWFPETMSDLNNYLFDEE